MIPAIIGSIVFPVLVRKTGGDKPTANKLDLIKNRDEPIGSSRQIGIN